MCSTSGSTAPTKTSPLRSGKCRAGSEPMPHSTNESRRVSAPLLHVARASELDAWTATPDGWLALLIVLDQFSRNIRRGTPLAFAADPQARALALAGIERGDDQRLTPVARLFCYLPLEHAEDAALQQRSVALFTAMFDGASEADRDLFAKALDFAQRHAQVIERFRRFPHRNAILGRSNTAAEVEYLPQQGAGF